MAVTILKAAEMPLFFINPFQIINIKNGVYRLKTVGTVFPCIRLFTVFLTGIHRINEVNHDGSNQKSHLSPGSKKTYPH